MEENMAYLHNGQGFGSVAERLVQNDCNPLALRPYIGDDGRHYVDRFVRNVRNKDGIVVPEYEAVPTMNTATLRKDEWIMLDELVIKEAQPRLKIWGDIVGAGLTYNIPNGLGKTILQWQTQSDINPAIVSMDGLRKGERQRPTYELPSMPLPITHEDFSFSVREIMASRNGQSPLDLSTVELASRKVAEMTEQLMLGTASTYTFGGGTVYGLTNHTYRNTKTLTSPTTNGWTPATLVNEVLAMKLQATQDRAFGPFMVYCSNNWDTYMDDDYSAAKGDNTLRERLKKIDGIRDVRTLDYLNNYDLVLVQMTSNTVQAVTGMGLTTLQWESHGGMQINFKVMCIMLPRVRADGQGRSGIVHGSV